VQAGSVQRLIGAEVKHVDVLQRRQHFAGRSV
jgi:hypothetical protein